MESREAMLTNGANVHKVKQLTYKSYIVKKIYGYNAYFDNYS